MYVYPYHNHGDKMTTPKQTIYNKFITAIANIAKSKNTTFDQVKAEMETYIKYKHNYVRIIKGPHKNKEGQVFGVIENTLHIVENNRNNPPFTVDVDSVEIIHEL